MPTILDFIPNDELKRYFWESDWYYCFFDDSDDEIHLEKIKTKIKIERRPNTKKKTIEFAVVRFDYSETYNEFSPFSTDDIWKNEEEAKSDFIWLKEFIELLSKDRKVFDGRYFRDFELSEGKTKLKNKFLGGFRKHIAY